MFTLAKDFRFEASHALPKHGGKCARLHGHSWVMTVEIQGRGVRQDGPSAGMTMDLGDISAVVQPLVEESLDHYHLNDTTGLDNPTCEELARWVYKRLRPNLPLLHAVTIQETCTSRVRYQPLVGN